MSKTTTKALSNEDKYAIADNMHKDLKGKIAQQVIDGDRKVLFGIVINTTNASGKTLTDVFSEEDSLHITNLVIQRLSHKFDAVTTTAF